MKLSREKTIIFAIACVLIVIVSSIYLFYFMGSESEDFGSPEIKVLETASSVTFDPLSYDTSSIFIVGQKIWVYQEYSNISHNGESDFYLNLSVIHEEGEVLKFIEDRVKNYEKSCFYYFETDESWPSGFYIVRANLVDYISNKSANSTASFFLV